MSRAVARLPDGRIIARCRRAHYAGQLPPRRLADPTEPRSRLEERRDGSRSSEGHGPARNSSPSTRARSCPRTGFSKAFWGTDALSDSALTRSIAELRHTLSDDAERPSLVETIPKRGYRLIAPVTPVTVPAPYGPMSLPGEGSDSRRKNQSIDEPAFDATLTTSPTQSAAVAPAAPYGLLPEQPRRGERVWLARPLATAVAIMTIVGGGLWLGAARWFVAHGPGVEAVRGSSVSSPGEERPLDGRKERPLAVLPFINLKPDAETDFLSFSLADAIIARLAIIRTIDVRAAFTVHKYRTQTPTLRQVAEDLHVSLILTGSYFKEGNVLRVTPQLVDVASNQTLYQESFDIEYDRLLAVQERVAAQLLSALHVSLSSHERERWESDRPRHPLAYEFFLRGRDYYEASRYTHGIEFFEKSVALDPEFARAWAFLGYAYALNASLRLGGREQYDKAVAAYKKAIALNPADPRPHVQMADILIETNRVEEAAQVLRDVLQQHSRDAHAFWGLAYAYRYAGLLDQSVIAAERSVAIDPFLLTGGNIFLTYLYQGEYDKFLRSFTIDDRSAYQVFYAGFGRYHLKSYEAAARDFDRAYELDSSLLQARVGKALSHAIKGKRAAATELLQATEREIDEREVGDAEGHYKLAQVYAVLHDTPAALRVLRKSIEGGFFCYPYFRNDPLMESVRREREYTVLLEQARQRHDRFKRRFF
jgi:TolB-like protein/DNA-binding winged helix-turn-helix (wHTH) protein